MERRLVSYNKVPSTMFLALLVTIFFIISTPLEAFAAQSGIEFYSIKSPPPEMKSLEPIMGVWWNWWENHSSAIGNDWPACLKGEIEVNNESVVFLGNPALAVEKNVNATRQKCEVSSSQLLYLTVYPGECSTGSKPGEGEFPDMKSTSDLLNCAQDSNKVIKLMEVKVDGNDVSSNIIRQSTSKPFNFVIPPVNSVDYKSPIIGDNNTSMAENYYLFFKPLPAVDHSIELEVIRQPLQANQPVEHDVAKWDIRVIP